jgi:hypothetical protein
VLPLISANTIAREAVSFAMVQAVLRPSDPIIHCSLPPAPGVVDQVPDQGGIFIYVFDFYNEGRSRRVVKYVTGED